MAYSLTFGEKSLIFRAIPQTPWLLQISGLNILCTNDSKIDDYAKYGVPVEV